MSRTRREEAKERIRTNRTKIRTRTSLTKRTYRRRKTGRPKTPRPNLLWEGQKNRRRSRPQSRRGQRSTRRTRKLVGLRRCQTRELTSLQLPRPSLPHQRRINQPSQRTHMIQSHTNQRFRLLPASPRPDLSTMAPLPRAHLRPITRKVRTTRTRTSLRRRRKLPRTTRS